MKINGRINIMGIKEIVFRYGGYGIFEEETKYVVDITLTWCRISSERKTGFYRTHEQMTRSIKALALNPHAELSFNDGLLVIKLE